jgi:hypothetical protein
VQSGITYANDERLQMMDHIIEGSLYLRGGFEDLVTYQSGIYFSI